MLHVYFEPYVCKPFSEFPYTKCHVGYLLLCKKPRLMACVRETIWTFVNLPLLGQSLITRIVTRHVYPIILIEKRVYEAVGVLAAILRPCIRRDKGGFAAMDVVWLEDYLQLCAQSLKESKGILF